MTDTTPPTPPSSGDGGAPASGGTPPCPPSVTFHMHLDADRDGKVDDDRTGLATWEWGKGKKGAIILCNNDDDSSASKLDNEDSSVNGGNDSDEIAPLVIRKDGTDPAPASMRATLEVSAADAKRIRVLDGRSSGAAEIIGPSKGRKYVFPDLNFTEKEFGMEALTYAGVGFDGLIEITFKITDNCGGSVEKGVVRVAPWIMPNHLDDAEKVYVVDAGTGNERFRKDLKKMVAAAGCSVVEHSSGDVWMQDCMEFGYANLPPDKGFRAVTRASRNRPLNTFPKTLLKADLGYNEPAPLWPGWPQDNTFNSTGNLEVTPPCTSSKGTKYPWGRIYFGGLARSRSGHPAEQFDAAHAEFLRKQIVQSPIAVDTTWLAVGHVDEIISFVPAPGGFKMLLASPKLAYDILKKNKATHGNSKLLTGRKFPHFDATGSFVGWRSAEVTIKKFLDVGLTGFSNATATKLAAFNEDIQKKLNTIKTQFETEIGLKSDTDLIHVPILFIPNEDNAITADALTAGMVNMLVINKHCIVPKPFGPVVKGQDLFEKALKDKLTPLGLTVEFLDDWLEYHVNLGEVHCGTNTLRKPKDTKWWEFVP